jgi:PGF-pre-PGF domain-containing protein
MQKPILLIILILFLAAIPAHADNNTTKPQIAPLNPDFVQYQEEMEQNRNHVSVNTISPSEDRLKSILEQDGSIESSLHPPGLVPSPIDFSYLSPVNTKTNGYGILSSYPSRYDLREENGVTPIRDQALAGSCWVFATYGPLESYLMHNKSEEWDFSEQHVKNTLLSSYPHDFYRNGHADGGYMLMVLAYLAGWSGPVTESDDPYDSLSPESSSDTVVAKHVQDAFIFPHINHTNNLFKQMIMDYGAISVAIHDNQSAYFNTENNTYYCYDEDKMQTHGVTLAGWDDDFNRTKFSPAAPADGAYIIKNSWGDQWADDGYYYISYYDTSIGNKDEINGSEHSPYTTNTVIMAENVSNYDQIYQYDFLGWCSNTGYNNTTALGANVFTATTNQTLEAVSFYTVDSNSYYNISVYLDPDNGPVNTSSAVSVKNGSIALPGYHTIDLDHNVSLHADQNFSIVIKFTTPEYTYPVAIEKAIDRYSNNANAEPGQSYLSSNGSNWTDVSASDINVCIKAFTTESRQPETNFVADKRYVHVNQSVQFHDASLYSPDSWKWDFGDDNTSTQQNPIYSYTSPGIYNVSLNTSNEFGNNITVRDTFIHVLNSTIYVNSSGGADFKTIQGAVDTASQGDTIIVEPGNYTERVSFRKDNLTVRSSTGNPQDVRITSLYSYREMENVYNNAVFIWADNITLQDIEVTGGFYGFFAFHSNNCNIINCTFTDNGLGMVLDTSNNNQIINCTFEKNIAGLVLTNSYDNYLANNSINNHLLYTFDMDSNSNYVDTSNTVDGKPIYSLVGKSDIVIDSDSNAALVHLVDCTNITIEDLECRNQRRGIYLYNTTDTRIRNYTSVQSLYGIYLDSSRYNILSNSTINDSRKIGIYLTDSIDNLVYNNYFNNTNNIHILAGSSNQWNITQTAGKNIINESYLGGNFWANPDGTGWSQVEYSIGNGFCQPYNLTDNGNNTDYLPLTGNAEKPQEPAETQTTRDNNVRIQTPTSTISSSNIISRDTDTQIVGRDAQVRYTFAANQTPVTGIAFNTQQNQGYVMTTVSLLHKLPADIDAPAGKAYRTMEIATGSKNPLSDNITIEFRVSRDWIEENNIDMATIRLAHYHEGEWEDLPGEQVDEDDENIYFTAETAGFSIFSIVGDEYRDVAGEPVAEVEEINEQPSDKEKSAQPEENAQMPGFTAIFAVALIAGVAMITRQKSNR